MENILNVNNSMEESIENGQVEGAGASAAEGAQEKTFTQADVDEIISKKTAQHYKKLGDYQKLSRLIAEHGGVEGETVEEQINFLEQFYGGGDGTAASAKAKKPDDTKSYVKALRYANSASDEDVYEKVQEILNTPAKNRSADDITMLETLGNRYGQISFRKEYDEAKKEYDGDLDALLKDEDFKDFSEGSRLPLNKLVAKYNKYKGGKEEKKTEPQHKSTGSVKNAGAAVAKEYYTPEEVDKLTSQQLDDPKIWEAVRKSMTKWKK